MLIADYFNYIFNLGVRIGIGLALGILIYGGVLYILSSNKPERIVSARQWIKSAVFGLLILLTSVFLLETINPQIVDFEIPGIQPSPIEKQSDIPSPPLKTLRTLINVEIPFGQIIEKIIFEKVPQEKEKSRIDRMKSIANNSLDIANSLKENSEKLKNLTEQCSCYNISPGNTPSGCSSDPCVDARGQIYEIEKENLKLMGIEIKETDDQGNPITIPPYIPNLISEQKKTFREIRLLKQEIGKLERTERFMLECPLGEMDSLASFLFSKDWYLANNWFLVNTRFWKEIAINNDYASFYCPVSGTILGEISPIPDEDIIEIGEEAFEPPDTLEKMHCREVPVGKVIDRSKRLGNKLVERLEKLTNLSEQMVNAVDQLHVLISQCNSQRCVVKEGICVGEPCPKIEIINQVRKIKNIVDGIPKEVNPTEPKQKEGIKDIATGPLSETLKTNLSKEKREQVGIIPILEDLVPGLIDDLDKKVRKEMQTCITDIPPEEIQEETEQPIVILTECEGAIRSAGDKAVIQKCFLEEKEFQKCLSQCYLEKKQDIYQKCLEQCLIKETGEKLDEIKTWRYKVDFFCCGK